MERGKKEDVVASLNAVFNSANLLVVTNFVGMTVAEASDLRHRMREGGAAFRVTKNRLAKRAVDGTKFAPVSGLFSGSTAIAYSDDPVAAAKIVCAYAKSNEKLVVIGGALGEEILDAEGIKVLAELPSLDELRAKMIALIQTPATRIAGILQAPGSQLARVIGAYAAKEDAA